MGNLSTPKSVQKLQKALHAKAKAEAGYRFYALYDKISRDDILAHAYAQCRSNKGAPGVDGQDFADIETYGVERWLGELALALREESYQPDPIRRVFIPKANGKLRPLGISTVRDRVCMTAAMLVLEPIFEADLPPEQYAYRPGRNAQQAVIEVEGLLFRGHPEVVDADLADSTLPIAPSMVRFRQTGLRDGLWPETRHLQRDLRSTKNRARRASVDSPNGGSGPTENCLRLRKKTSSEPARTLLPVAGDCDIVPFGLPSIVVDRQGARGNLISALARHLAQYLLARLEVLFEAHCDRYSRTRRQPVFEPRHPNHANGRQRGKQYCCAIESDTHQDANRRR